MGHNSNVDLPALPESHSDNVHNIIHRDQLSRKKLQGLLHLITGELKARGTKTPHIFLPFRSRVDDVKLSDFLSRVFPKGIMINTSQDIAVKSLLREFDEFTLICGLKYLWCRLPNDEIIGWNVYLEFKRKEHEAGYPKDAFLTIMPKCLSSSSHASIVYDFLDLLISIASNSQYNHLSGRKISKMASLWAFRSTTASRSAFYDATLVKEVSFLEGLDSWKQTCNGLFHLLLAFLRAMLPDTGAEALNLPKTLQSLLITNSYPPPQDSSSTKSVITIPCVHIRSTRKSANPFDLIDKVRQNLSFEQKDSFLSIENYTILRNIFQKPTTDEIVSTLTEESRRILTRLTAYSASLDYRIYPGWSQNQLQEPEDPNIPQYSEINISNVTLQDYFIWTWLSSLGSDQCSTIKSSFGRSIVVEAGLRGFQKWMVLTETSISSDEYIKIFKGSDNHQESKKIVSPKIPASRINAELPPPPPVAKPKALEPITTNMHSQSNPPPAPPKSPVKSNHQPQAATMLPALDFGADDFSLDSPHSFVTSPVFESRGYTSPIPFEHETKLAHNFEAQANVNPSKNNRRPRPPPLSPNGKSPSHERETRPSHHPERVPEKINNQSPYDYPEFQEHQLYTSAGFSDSGYSEPFDNYETPYDSNNQPVSSEPFDNYVVPGEPRPDPPTKHLTPADVQKKYYQITPNPPQKASVQASRAPKEAVQNAYPKQHSPPVSSHPDQFGTKETSSHNQRTRNRDNEKQGHDTNLDHSYQMGHPIHQPRSHRAEQPDHQAHTHHSEDQSRKENLETPNYAQPAYYNDTPQAGNVHYDGKGEYKSNDEYRNNENYRGNVEPDYREQNTGYDEEQAEAKLREKEERKKKKKKKRSSKQKELLKMMEQFPDAPPPSLPMEIQNPNPSIDQSAPSHHDDHRAYPQSGTHQRAHDNHYTEPRETHREHKAPKGQTSENYSNSYNHAYNYEASNMHAAAEESTGYSSNHYGHPGHGNQDEYYSGGESPLKVPNSAHSHAAHGEPRQPSPNHGYYQPDHLTPTTVSHSNSSVPQSGPSSVISHIKESSPFPTSAGTLSSDSKSPSKVPQANSMDKQPNYSNRHSPTAASHGAPAPYNPNAPPAETHAYYGHHTDQQQSHQRAPPQHAHYQQPEHHQMRQQNPSPGHAVPQTGHAAPMAPMAAAPPMAPAAPMGQPIMYQGQPMPQYYPGPQANYQPSMQGHYQAPPQQYYPPPPQAYQYSQHGGHAPPQGYFPPQPPRQPMQPARSKPTTSELTMMNMPAANTFNKNTKNKAGLRAALKQGEFGI